MPALPACRLVPAMLLFLPFALLGCSSGVEDNRAGLSCLDDSKECIDSRQATLKGMLADKDRAWVKEPATPHAHASGVRLFAYRTQKKEMSCEELAAGRREADNAARAMRSADAKGLSPAQIARATMFAAEVSKELSVEMKSRRCKA
ncbi:MAG: hypothetical protein EKK41_08400 [Hyphomicrobiales bacterium]|nr:MAG: hypothetical protein EKK41_08400 [Hyphomicrobiales bacterium]